MRRATRIRRMDAAGLLRIGEIDRSERITQQYRMRDGVLELVDVDIDADRWGGAREGSVQHYIDRWNALLDDGAVLLGAYDDDALVGIAIVDPAFEPGLANFCVLHVTRTHRRSGVGRQLSDEVARLAREAGAKRLYVSATPTRGTVDFYMAQGFTPLAAPHAKLFALEPDDIHLDRPL